LNPKIIKKANNRGKLAMKYFFLIVLSALLITVLTSAVESAELGNQKSKLSYSVGYQVGGDFLRQGKEINPDVLLKGIQDAMAGNEPVMSRQEMSQTLSDLQKSIVEAQQKKMLERAEKVLAEGKRFLAENAKKEGVKTLPSGLQYKVIEEGSGKSPTAADTVTVQYTGTLIDGTEFDSSYKRDKPATFPVNRVIDGWTEALLMMKEGSKWRLFIPPELAYGDKRAGNIIEPNSTLIFDVELIDVKHTP
jgi:FKBP-type peptidyl-prolyl cis-trans isomerase FklB